MKKHVPFILSIMTLLVACGGSGIVTNPDNSNPNNPPPSGNQTTAASFANASTNLNLFSLPSEFPPDLKIPDIAGMENTAFVVNFFPVAVLAIDLNANPPALSTQFQGFDATGISEVGFPAKVQILSPTLAVLLGTSDGLGSSGVVVFNPTSGALLQTVDLSAGITLTDELPYSRAADCDGDTTTEDSEGPGSYVPVFASDLAIAAGRLFISFSNLCFDASGSVYSQGLVLVFDIQSSPPYLTPAAKPYIIVQGFNATGLTAYEGDIIVTSTGDTDFAGGVATPVSDSYLTKIDAENLTTLAVRSLGEVAATFTPLAVSSDGSRGYIGSSAFSEVYEINLDTFQVLRGANNPILIFGETDDFITDQEMAFGDQILFVSSFNHSGVKAIDLSGTEPALLPSLLDFAFEGNPGLTGAGPMALKPGQPGVDFSGADLWILTSSPGTLSNAQTY